MAEWSKTKNINLDLITVRKHRSERKKYEKSICKKMNKKIIVSIEFDSDTKFSVKKNCGNGHEN